MDLLTGLGINKRWFNDFQILKGLRAGVAQFVVFAVALVGGSSAASATDGLAEDWQLGFSESVTPIMDQIIELHDFLLILITVISVFVLLLLLYVIVRFNARANPVPSKTTHSTSLEIAWTVVPIIILAVLAVPSFRLLSAQYDFPKPDVTIKAIGHQWYWEYSFVDHEGVEFDANMVEDSDLKSGQPRLLATDNAVVVPVNKVVHVLLTADATGVIHNWTVPSFGVKADAVPGRVTRVWFKARKTGTYYGQCSELCGKDHAFMPIEVKVVTEKEYERWLKEAPEKFAGKSVPSKAVEFAGIQAGSLDAQ